MKKILYVTNITRNVNSFFIPHLNMLIDEGHSVDCACKITGEHAIKKEKLRDGINFYDIPVTRNPLNFKNIISLYKLYKIQKSNKYDVIHVHSPIIGAYTRLLKIVFPTVEMIYTAHGYHFHKGASKLTWLIFYNVEKFLARYTDTLITINDEDYEVSKDFKCKKLIKMNGVGVDLSEFKELGENEKKRIRNEIGVNEDDFILIMVGEHNKNKNQIQLIKAIKEIENKYPKIKAIFIGDGELLEENKRYIKEHNIQNAIILGFRTNVNELINASDILVSLSYREGLPKNIIEGLACKKVIIGTNVRGITDLIERDLNGDIIEVGEVRELIESVEKIYRKPNDKFNEMRENSLIKAKQYDINYILKELKEVY